MIGLHAENMLPANKGMNGPSIVVAKDFKDMCSLVNETAKTCIPESQNPLNVSARVESKLITDA